MLVCSCKIHQKGLGFETQIVWALGIKTAQLDRIWIQLRDKPLRMSVRVFRLGGPALAGGGTILWAGVLD